jgi:hypothetical protein
LLHAQTSGLVGGWPRHTLAEAAGAIAYYYS